MKPSAADRVIVGLKAAGITFLSVLPDGWLVDVYRRARADPFFTVVHATNEGEGVGICAGAWLGGKRSAMLMENSGLRVASEVLARLQSVPVQLLLSYRGDIGDENYWAVPAGETMEPLLRALRIPYTLVRDEDAIVPAIVRARKTLNASRYHVAVAFSGDVVW